MFTRINLKHGLFKITGCEVQHTGWPCNTCFHSIEFGISPEKRHEIWESLLAYRGDYSLAEVGQSKQQMQDNMILLSNILTQKQLNPEVSS